MDFVTDFIKKVNATISEIQKVQLMNVSLQATPERWWVSHHNLLREWQEVKTTLVAIFRYSEDYPPNFVKYQGVIDCQQHLQDCKARWIRE